MPRWFVIFRDFRALKLVFALMTAYLLYDEISIFISKPTFTSLSQSYLRPEHFPEIQVCESVRALSSSMSSSMSSSISSIIIVIIIIILLSTSMLSSSSSPSLISSTSMSTLSSSSSSILSSSFHHQQYLPHYHRHNHHELSQVCPVPAFLQVELEN